jgi:predicted hydrocarbon binding protein
MDVRRMVVDGATRNLEEILKGNPVSYRAKLGNFVSIIPGLTNATIVCLSPGLAREIKEMGRLLGRSVISEFVEAKDFKGVMHEIKDLLEVTKFGRIEVLSLKEDSAVFNVYECADCGGLPDVGRPLCAFDEGLIEGILAERTECEYEVREVDCFGTGEKYCEFEVRKL